jgi:predicted DNA-binding protein
MATIKGKQIITNVYLEPEVYTALKKLSEATGAPMAYYIRRGVDKVLTEVGGPGFEPPVRRRARKPK